MRRNSRGRGGHGPQQHPGRGRSGVALVVDWKAEQRADLEAIHDGIAVIAWDDKGLRLLKRCRLTGNFGSSVQVRADVVRLETADDVQASLPLGGLGIAGKIGGEFSRGDARHCAHGRQASRPGTTSRRTTSRANAGASHCVRAPSWWAPSP
jgi:hypothetical protein